MNKRTAPCPAFQCIRFLPLVAALGYPVSSYSVTFELANGEINGRIDTSLSAGLSVSTANPDIDLIPTAYGGRAGGINGNDARQNFEKGDVISNVYRGTTEISLNYQNYGAFVRGKYWYDHWLETKNGRFKDFDDSGFDNLAKFKGVELMDAYVWGEFNVADRPLDIRIGKQVVNWGESTFIQGGINVINPIDVNAINKPGIEIKEALIPVNMINASLGITDNLTVEAFYQLEWQKTVLPGCGTFFAGNDVMQPGCGPAYAVSGLTEEQQENMSLVNPMLPSFSNMVIEREEDDKPSDSGQWGVSFRYFAESLNNTEFGFYYINYHSRLPYMSAIAADYNDRPGSGFFLNGITNNPAYGDATTPFIEGPQYIVDYPEDIEVFGVSFNTQGPWGMSLGGEVSYRPNLPIQINSLDFLYATGFLDTESPIVGALFDIAVPQPGAGPIVANANDLYGARVNGYIEKPVTQAQTTMIQTFTNVAGAENLVLVGELGVVHVGELEPKDQIKYGRSAAYGSGVAGTGVACKNAKMRQDYCVLDGYTTSLSWGYRLKAALNYSDVFSGVNMSPGIAIKHDVNGYSYAPGSQFVEGRKAATLSLKMDYLGTYNADVSYTNFFGGDYNTQSDRDFIAMSVGVKF